MRKTEPALRRTLLLLLLGPLVLLLALDSAVSWWTSRRVADQAYDRGLHEIAREAALHVRKGPSGPRLDLPAEAQRAMLVDQEDRLALRVWSSAGIPLGGDHDLQPPVSPPPSDGTPRFYSDALRGDEVRVATSWQTYGGGADRVLVQVAETLNKRRRLAWEFVGGVVVAQLLLIAIACTVVYWGVAVGLRPLHHITAALARRSQHDLSPLEVGHVPGEVRPLLEEVNALMLRLGSALHLQARFVADAAHQLKTPVAGLKAQIDLALDEQDLPRVRRSLAQMYVSAGRLSRLVQQLLVLARNDPSAAAVRLQPVDLEAFSLEVCMDWVPRAMHRSIDLGFEGCGQPAWVDAEPDRLRDLLNNLLDNAVLYSRGGGRVTVRLELSQAETVLSVSDDGPTIPAEERARVFERFHRLLDGSTEGSGLGLAIVSEIAALHGARITVREDADGTGNTFAVHFRPMQPAAA